mmetsp:Transcript_64782/g.208633  ORF Transcript_64782/g.208633 Transcript_64782/m.208633 type:complete len:231 (+) Transcript_64782:79-771(+)
MQAPCQVEPLQCVKARDASAICAPTKHVETSQAPSSLAPARSEPSSFASLNTAPLRSAPASIESRREAHSRHAWRSTALCARMPSNCEWLRSAPCSVASASVDPSAKRARESFASQSKAPSRHTLLPTSCTRLQATNVPPERFTLSHFEAVQHDPAKLAAVRSTSTSTAFGACAFSKLALCALTSLQDEPASVAPTACALHNLTFESTASVRSALLRNAASRSQSSNLAR